MARKFQDEFCINIYTGVHQQATIFINTKFLRKVNSCFFELTINWLWFKISLLQDAFKRDDIKTNENFMSYSFKCSELV